MSAVDDEDARIRNLSIGQAQLFSDPDGDDAGPAGNQRRSQAGAATLRLAMSRACRICHKMGHGIRRCPQLLGVAGLRKIRNAAGIPRTKLRPITVKDLDSDVTTGDIYSLADGSLFVLVSTPTMPTATLTAAHLRQRLLQYFVPSRSIQSESLTSLDLPSVFANDTSLEQLEEAFKCPLCKCLINSPRAVVCCGHTFCHLCIRAHLGKFEGKCPRCNAHLDASTDLVVNTTLQATISALREAVLNEGVAGGNSREGPVGPSGDFGAVGSALPGSGALSRSLLTSSTPRAAGDLGGNNTQSGGNKLGNGVIGPGIVDFAAIEKTLLDSAIGGSELPADSKTNLVSSNRGSLGIRKNEPYTMASAVNSTGSGQPTTTQPQGGPVRLGASREGRRRAGGWK